MNHRIGLLVIVITSTYPVPTPQSNIRMGLFFYVKILESNSVSSLQIDKNCKKYWTDMSKLFWVQVDDFQRFSFVHKFIK